jgi:HEAT repeat protein
MLWWTLRGLKSSNPEARKEAAQKAGASGNARAVPALIEAIRDEDAPVRVAVMEALGRLGDPKAIEPLTGFLVNPVKKERRSKYEHHEAHDITAAAMALSALGEAAFESLLAALLSESREVRRASVQALGAFRSPRAVAPLVRALDDSRSEVRKAAALALGDRGDRSALTSLSQALAHKDPDTRRAAAEALGKLGGDDAVLLLARAVEDREESVQMTVIAALKGISGASAALSLKPALHGGRKTVRAAAAAALKSISIPAATAEERAAIAVLTGDFAAAVREGHVAVKPLTEALHSADVQHRRLAASSLGELAPPRAVPSLIRALRDHDAEVRETAARALSGIGTEAVLPLFEVLTSPDVTAQRLAAQALGRIGDIRAVRPLVECIRANRQAGASYLEPLEAARAARDALSAILSRGADQIPTDDLERINSVPDALQEHQVGDDEQSYREEIAVDCSELRHLSRTEIEKRS